MANNTIRGLLDRITSTGGCKTIKPSGIPEVHPFELPQDLAIFYSLCGGAILFEGADYGIEIVPPFKFVKANPVIAGVEGETDISCDWFIVAQQGEQYITIDLGNGRIGRCYDSFWDRHAVAGSCPIIARSFTELLERLLDGRGAYWYWLKPNFVSLGDAYE